MRFFLVRCSLFIIVILLYNPLVFSQKDPAFSWPKNKQVAISLTFDDARLSQPDTGIALLNKYGVKATFYVVPAAVKMRLDGWKKAVASGQEIGNHSLFHPCTGNFAWSRDKALENYTIEKMRTELIKTNDSIQYLLGVKATSFAYPCGQTFVGRGKGTKSYVPIIADLFVSGRGWLDEGPNDPSFCDLSQLTGMEMDGKDFDKILELINQAKENGSWLILAGHEMGEGGTQTTRLPMLKQLIEYAQDASNKIWLAPVNEVAAFVNSQRKK